MFDLILGNLDHPEEHHKMLKKFKNYQKLAEIYYVYHSIQRYTVSLGIAEFQKNICVL